MERVHVVIGNALLERGLRRDRVGARRHEAETDRDAMHVRVNWKERTIEREEQDARRGLGPDAWERNKRVPELRVGDFGERALIERNAAVTDPAEHRPDADGFRRPEAPAADRFRKRGKRRIGDLVPDLEPSAEIRVGTIAVGVAGVLRQDGQDQLLEWGQVSRWWRYAVRASEATSYRAKASPVH